VLQPPRRGVRGNSQRGVRPASTAFLSAARESSCVIANVTFSRLAQAWARSASAARRRSAACMTAVNAARSLSIGASRVRLSSVASCAGPSDIAADSLAKLASTAERSTTAPVRM